MARRPIPFRIRIAIAGLAGLGLAWLIPKGGDAPVSPGPAPTGASQPGLTAEQVPLDRIPQGISFHAAGEVRVFLSRSGETVIGFLGRSTASGDGSVWWCPRNSSFENGDGMVRYDRDGRALLGTAPRDLDRVRVLVTAGMATIFPQNVTAGAPAAPGSLSGERLPAPCAAAERVG